MRTEEVAREERLRLGAVREHRIGPVQKRRADELQRHPAQVETVAIADNHRVAVGVQQLPQQRLPTAGADDLGLREGLPRLSEDA